MIGHDRMVHIMSYCIFDSLNVIVIQLVSFSPARTEREIMCCRRVLCVVCLQGVSDGRTCQVRVLFYFVK